MLKLANKYIAHLILEVNKFNQYSINLGIIMKIANSDKILFKTPSSRANKPLLAKINFNNSAISQTPSKPVAVYLAISKAALTIPLHNNKTSLKEDSN